MSKTTILKPHGATIMDNGGGDETDPISDQVVYEGAPEPGDPDYPAYLRHRARMDAIREAFATGGVKAAYEVACLHDNAEVSSPE